MSETHKKKQCKGSSQPWSKPNTAAHVSIPKPPISLTNFHASFSSDLNMSQDSSSLKGPNQHLIQGFSISLPQNHLGVFKILMSAPRLRQILPELVESGAQAPGL